MAALHIGFGHGNHLIGIGTVSPCTGDGAHEVIVNIDQGRIGPVAPYFAALFCADSADHLRKVRIVGSGDLHLGSHEGSLSQHAVSARFKVPRKKQGDPGALAHTSDIFPNDLTAASTEHDTAGLNAGESDILLFRTAVPDGLTEDLTDFFLGCKTCKRLSDPALSGLVEIKRACIQFNHSEFAFLQDVLWRLPHREQKNGRNMLAFERRLLQTALQQPRLRGKAVLLTWS